MATKQISIGSMTAVHQYDSGSFTKSMTVEDPITCSGTPIDDDDLIKLGDLKARIIKPVEVVDIDSPTELNSVTGDSGVIVVVYETGTTDVYTIYAYDASGPTVNMPTVVDASGSSSERWLAIGGINSTYTIDHVEGPASSTNNAIATFDGTGGDELQSSLVTIDSSGSISLPSGEEVDGVDISDHAADDDAHHNESHTASSHSDISSSGSNIDSAVSLKHTEGNDTSVGSLSVYASNAAATAGGLGSGDLYRSGGDPDLVCIVH